ncbi:MAG: GAF domain-containing protein [Desulfobacteraceae bacterium]|nr:MAG: GAF domain-containing protein [Desulfobacteraceae bacterium]
MEADGGNSDPFKIAGRLKKMIAANQYLAEIESLDSLIPKLLELIRNVTNSQASSLLLYDPQRDRLKFASVADEVIGESGGEILKKAVEIKLGEGIAGWAAKNRKSLMVNDVAADPRHFQKADKKTGFHTKNMISVPLIHQGELLGVINALNAKAKPHFDIEDQEILESFAHLASIAIVRSKLLEARISQQRLQIQLEAASKIQMLFWPKIPELKADWNCWAASIPAAFVGGDLYDLIPMPDGSWVAYVADVSDKGLPAALIMVALWSRIRMEAFLHENLENLLGAVNDAMFELMANEGFFATIILGRYWPETGRMQLVRGGHLAPVLIGKNTQAAISNLKGISLGVAPGIDYKKLEITLAPGESILFLTDGATEAENENGELFGHERLINYLKKAPSPPRGKGLLDAVNKWRGRKTANDDLTILEIWRDRKP